MDWTDDRARQEFRWLKLMARLKYDGYDAFRAGMRFVESLITWLQQFKLSDRETAYTFVRNALVYIGPLEIQRLVEQFFPRIVRDRIVRMVAHDYSIQPYQVFTHRDASIAVDRLRRQTLFMGLSDGARIDTIRHSNSGVLSNEQFVQVTQIDTEKWRDLLQNLRNDLNESCARFRLIYLIDDFAGTGSSFLRYDRQSEKWKGKYVRFRSSVDSANRELGSDRPFHDKWRLGIHHYVASSDASSAIESNLKSRAMALSDDGTEVIHTSFGMILPIDLPLTHADLRFDAFVGLTEIYYDSRIETAHTAVGGVDHLGLGYGGCGLPLVFEHNTPNNSVGLLWAEADAGNGGGASGRGMRALFRRRERHG